MVVMLTFVMQVIQNTKPFSRQIRVAFLFK